MLTIFDIFKLQLGKLIYESINDIGPANNVIKFTRASNIHTHDTRFANEGNFYVNSVRTVRYGIKGLQIQGARLWETLPKIVKDKPTKKSFINNLKKHMVDLC